MALASLARATKARAELQLLGQPRRPRAPQSRRAPAGARRRAPPLPTAADWEAGGRRGSPGGQRLRVRQRKWPSPSGDSRPQPSPGAGGRGPREAGAAGAAAGSARVWGGDGGRRRLGHRLPSSATSVCPCVPSLSASAAGRRGRRAAPLVARSSQSQGRPHPHGVQIHENPRQATSHLSVFLKWPLSLRSARPADPFAPQQPRRALSPARGGIRAAPRGEWGCPAASLGGKRQSPGCLQIFPARLSGLL